MGSWNDDDPFLLGVDAGRYTRHDTGERKSTGYRSAIVRSGIRTCHTNLDGFDLSSTEPREPCFLLLIDLVHFLAIQLRIRLSELS